MPTTFHVYYHPTEKKYKLRSPEQICEVTEILVTFYVFDMAYDYVTRMNGDKTQAYSRWIR